MKDSLSSIDVAATAASLGSAVGGFLDKVYHPKSGHLVLRIRTPGEGRSYIHFHAGRWLYQSDSSGEMPQDPTPFARMLRKRLTGARISGISQRDFERIVVVSFEKDGGYDLVLELFGKGNAILVKDGVIVQPLVSRTWKHRDVRAKKPFVFPPPIPNPLLLTPAQLLDVLRRSDADMVRTLATKLNLGGRYSEEVCLRADVDRAKQASEASDADAEAVLEAVRGLASEAGAGERGYVVLRDGEVEDVVPLRMRIYDGAECEEVNPFPKAVEAYVQRLPARKEESPTPERDAEMDRIKRTLAQQEAAALQLQREGGDAQAMGDDVFANYGDVAHALMTAKDRLSQSKGLEDLPGFVSFDRKNGILVVELGSKAYELDVNGTVESTAQRYYEKGKKLKAKLEGLFPALEETRRTLADWERRGREEDAAKAAPKPTKRFWFERYRWFISSEGAVVLGGKDAKTNDMLVKKHLEPGDRYAHADVHGAPSVVVKMAEGVGEETLREACEFAVATSKAWSAKIGSAVGYWVLPEQVSKTPQSGEYLARGAFVVRGKRNYSDKFDMRLALGEVEFEGERKIMCGPESAVRARSERMVVIRPGEIDKNFFAKLAAAEFGVPIEEVQSILPPGNIDVVEQVGTRLDVTHRP